MFPRIALAALLGAALLGCGSSSPAADAGSPGLDAGPVDGGYDPSCSQPGTPGNSKGVGKFCTPHGTECQGQHAGFCSVTFDSTATQWFCTTPCSCDSECGENAICTGDPSNPNSLLGCVPLVCAGSDAVGTACYPDGGAIADGGAIPDGGGA
jgi:hypothetical protein